MTRRSVLKQAAAASVAVGLPSCSESPVPNRPGPKGRPSESVAILKADRYDDSLLAVIEAGFELVPPPDVNGKRVLLKPNLVDLPRDNRPSVTNPAVIAAAAEAFRKRGAAEIIVGDGPALQRDAVQIVDAIGLTSVLKDHGLPFVDLATDTPIGLANRGVFTTNTRIFIAKTAVEADVLVSMPKMKTHHWAGASLSLKNLFGMTSAMAYGWPRNRFHLQGLHGVVLDVNRTRGADYTIVDAVVGLQGDGPILGDPIDVGALVMGRNSTAVDATCARLMEIDPTRIPYLNLATRLLGPVAERDIAQRGEAIATVARSFDLLPHQAYLRPSSTLPADSPSSDSGVVI